MSDAANSVEAIFNDALRQPDPGQRTNYLATACGSDARLCARVEALLKAHDDAGNFMAPSADSSPDPIDPLGAATVDGNAVPFRRPSVSPLDVPLSEKPGSVIGRYKLLQQIGEGGFGVVYMAEQEKPVKRRVALKVIKAGMDTRAVIARFEAERQALAMMDHPNIARVLDVGATDAGRPYFVMELVKGIPITDYCDQANLDMRERLELFIDVCRAVQHAHQKGIIHRDLKPSNIMVTLRDDKPNVKVIDFGIAKATEQKLTERTLFTAYGEMIGTPVYMSPEQAVMSEFDVDTRSDVYSLGVVLYEMLTGSPPFDAQTLRQAGFDEMRRIIREEPPQKPSTKLSTMAQEMKLTVASQRQISPQALSRQLHGDLDWIVLKAIEKDRARRYESASAFAHDIERHLNSEPVLAGAPGVAYKLKKFMRRNKGPMAVAAGIALLMLVGTAVSTWQAIRATQAEKHATGEAVRATMAEKQAKDEAARATTAEQLAKTRLTEVAAERDAKEIARKDAEQISTFLREVFQSPDPTRDGRTIQVVELLDKAAKKLATDLTAQPARRAKLQAALGGTYYALGLAREAIPLQEKVRDYCRATFGPEHPDTLQAMNNLAISYFAAGRRDEAIKLGEEVLARRRKVLGPEHPHTLKAMISVSTFYAGPRRRDEAIKMTEGVLMLSRKVNGPEHPDTLKAINNLAVLYAAAGRADEALKMSEGLLTLSRKVRGPEHPDTLRAMNNLAVFYAAAGRRDEALKMKVEVLTLSRKVLGEEHPETLNAINNLAVSYSVVGRRDEAIKLCEEVLALRRKVLGPEHPATFKVMITLSIFYAAAGHADKALKMQEEVLALRRKVNGPEDLNTLIAMNNLAISYLDAGRLEEAIKLREESLTLYRKVRGPKHRDTLAVMKALADSYCAQGEVGKAEALEKEIAAARAKPPTTRP